MFCFKCGKELSGNMLFCPYCGNKTIIESNKIIDEEITNKACENTNSIVKQENCNKNKLGNLVSVIYNSRKLLFSALYITIFLLFFCNFLKIEMLGTDILKVNGFTAIKYLFDGDFFDKVVNNNIDFSSLKTLIQIAYFAYFILLVFLAESFIVNIVALIKKENNVNKFNFENSINIFVASTLITILYFVIKKDFNDLYGNLFTYSSGSLSLAIVSLISLLLSILCRFGKINNEKCRSLRERKEALNKKWNEINITTINEYQVLIIIELILLLSVCFIVQVFTLSPFFIDILYFMSILLTVINLIFIFNIKNKRDCHIQNIFIQIIILAFCLNSFNILTGVLIVVSIVSIIISFNAIKLINKQKNMPKLHFNDVIKINKGLFIEIIVLIASPIIAYVVMPPSISNLFLTMGLLSGIFFIINLIHNLIVNISSRISKKELLLEKVIKENEQNPSKKRSEFPLVIFSFYIAIALIICLGYFLQ